MCVLRGLVVAAVVLEVDLFTMRPGCSLVAVNSPSLPLLLPMRTLLQSTYTGDNSWPPIVPGWVYFPSCDSPGYAAAEAPHNLSRHSSIQSLLAEAEQHNSVVAVSTTGETKRKLRPQVLPI